MEQDLIKDFIAEVVADAGIDGSDRATYQLLLKTLEERVVARLLLELIARMTPEEAAKMKEELEAESPNPEKYFGLLAESGHLTPQILMEKLASIRRELLEELSQV